MGSSWLNCGFRIRWIIMLGMRISRWEKILRSYKNILIGSMFRF